MADVSVVRPLVLGLVTVVASCWMTAAVARVSDRAIEAHEIASRAPPPPAATLALTVRVDAVGCGWFSSGSGALLGDRLVVSNRHVVAGAASVGVTGVSPTGVWSTRATVVGAAPDQDLVLLRLDSPVPAPAVELAPNGFQLREGVAFGGFPGGQQLRVRAAAVSSRWSHRAPSADGPVWVLSEAGVPGMSGGPVLNGQGELVGIVFAFEERSRTTLALGSELVAQLVADTGTRTTPLVVSC